MRVKYEGADEARELAVTGGFLTCPAGEWVDLADAAAEALIPEHHLEQVFLGLADQPDWSLDPPVADYRPKPARKPRKPRKATKKAAAPAVVESPATGTEEDGQ